MKDPKYYRRLPYRRLVEPRQDSTGRFYFLARIAEIPALRIHGQTREEALLKLDQIFDDVIEAILQAGETVVEPEPWPILPVDEQPDLDGIPPAEPREHVSGVVGFEDTQQWQALWQSDRERQTA